MESKTVLKAVRNRNYVYVVLYHNRQTIRINTLIEAKRNEMSLKCLIKGSVADSEAKNLTILAIRAIVERYASSQIEDGKNLIQSECSGLVLASLESEKKVIHEKIITLSGQSLRPADTFLSEYTRFIRERTKELNLTHGTGKIYNSLQNALKHFSKHTGKPLTFEYMNDRSTLIEFKNYMSVEMKYSDNTTCRRLASLRTYYRWLENNEIYLFHRNIYSVRQTKYQKEIVTLSISEIRALIALHIENKAWERVVDLFVCNCFLGLRVSDLMTLDRGEFRKDKDGDLYYIKENIKTGIEVNIPITDIPLRIFQKYNFKLPKYTGQYFNRELQKVLKHYKLFEYPINHIRKVQKESQNLMVMKRDLITSHTCRKTFITLSVSRNIPLNVIMKASGHTQIKTLNSYVEAVMDKNEFRKLSFAE